MPNTQPPPSRRVQIEAYSPLLSFAKNDIVASNGVWFKCSASNVTKVMSGQSIMTNACNNGGPQENTGAWVKLGDNTVVDLTQPVFATAWNENLNFKIGDYYADSSLKKVFKCIGSDPSQAVQIRNSEVLCRQPYSAAVLGGWQDVTSTVPFLAKYMDYKYPLRVFKDWFSEAVYLRGDVVLISNAVWICKADNCDDTQQPGAAA